MADEMRTSGFALFMDWEQVLISSAPKRRDYEGHRIADLAAEADISPYAWIFDALLETELDIGIVVFHSSAENRMHELRYPTMMIGTDGAGLATSGPLAKGKPHPRNFGTSPLVLGRYVRELAVLSLEEAVYRMTGLPAEKLRWTDRGLVQKEYQADLVVLNPETIADRATYENPKQYPLGIPHVIVNGKLVVHNGGHTAARPGVVLGRA
jgi:N-acyl-D-amino-acid deacylase